MTGADTTLIVGLHGVLHRYPWIDRVSREFDLDEDVFSLAVKRAAAYGWSNTDVSGAPEGTVWDHNDAGGDWGEDGENRQLAWLQATLPNRGSLPTVRTATGKKVRPRGPRLPLLPAVTVLNDALHRVGTVHLTGAHALVPLRVAGDSRFELAMMADWFALADPDGAEELAVTVSSRSSAGLSGRAAEVRDAVVERGHDVMAVETVKHAAGAVADGLARPLAGQVQAEGMRPAMSFRCRVREWSADVAAWTTELFADALRGSTGTSAPVLITVARGRTT
ncbi:hypothetical protein DSC45_33075 [Streptomyces sp. YIM 130001]|uniref:hypothetical protein n=1 Tax=Streptomyces sp. YIM 130001 TaxID=2259644 RepID=UPI000E65A795|nr:hypothetical protein [Streptomyces sp. YIM 130001]RII08550.1 hypothetical protein DSC45_33075 [Streptomyces sp. YIM 130001]